MNETVREFTHMGYILKERDYDTHCVMSLVVHIVPLLTLTKFKTKSVIDHSYPFSEVKQKGRDFIPLT